MDDPRKRPDLTAFREPPLSAEAFLLCTPSGRVRYSSGALKLMVEEDLTGRNLNDFLEDGTAARLVSESLAGRGCSFSCVIRGQRFRCEAEPLEEREGIQIALFPVAPAGPGSNPASDRRLAREINTSLAVLMPAVQLLEDSALPQQEEYLAVLRLHHFRLLRLARNLEDMALVENGTLPMDPRREDLTALCRDLLERARPYLKARQIALQARLPDQPVIYWADGEKVRRMVLNLLSNAAAAQRDGGTVFVTLRERDDGTVVLSVTDQGAGISTQALSNLYRAYEEGDPVREGGAGLGLALTRAFAQAHGGQLMLMSGEKGGLSARIVLPKGEEPALGSDGLRAWHSAYGVGIDLVRVELSVIADKDLFRKEAVPEELASEI